MTPTAKLRFVEREQATGQMITHRKILQQWWENRNMRLAVQAFDEYGTPIARYQGEWRDIPVETEDFTQNKTSG